MYNKILYNSPGPWPRALKIIGTLSLSYQVTLVTCWAGRGGSLKLVPCTILALSHLVLVPLFSIQKIIKKSTSQKINFFGILGDFLRFVDAFFTILGLFWVPQGVIFRLFWQVKLSVDLFTNFLKKKQTLKKTKM